MAGMLMSVRNRNRSGGVEAWPRDDYDDAAQRPAVRDYYRRVAKHRERQAWRKAARKAAHADD